MSYQDATLYLSSTPVAIVAGFVLATAAVVVSQRATPEDIGVYGQLGIVVLVLSGVLLLAALIVAFYLRLNITTPAQLAEWEPDFALDSDSLELARTDMRNRLYAGNSYLGVLSVLNGTGFSAALIGLALSIVSYGGQPGHWIAAGVCVVGGIAMSTLFLVDSFRKRFEKWAERNVPSGGLQELTQTQRDLLAPPVHDCSRRGHASPAAWLNGMAISTDTAWSTLYQACTTSLRSHADGVSSGEACWVATVVVDGVHRRAVALHPLARRPEGGVRATVYADVCAARNGCTLTDILAVLGTDSEILAGSGYLMWVSSADQIDRLLTGPA